MYFITASVAILTFLFAPLALTNPLARRDSWGGAISLGPTKSTITNAVTTLIPGAPPTTQNGMLFIWPGMSNGTGDLVQTTLESWPTSSGGDSWCGASAQEWCIRASLFGGFGQKDGNAAVVGSTTPVRIEYNLMSDGQTWEQIVTNANTGANMSYFSYPSGPYMRGYGTGVECDNNCSPTVSTAYFLNTRITLAGADASFPNTLGRSGTASYSGLAMENGNTVLTISNITLPANNAS